MINLYFSQDLGEGGQDVWSDLLSSTREHCQMTKARVFESKDGRADCPDSPRGYEKCGLR